MMLQPGDLILNGKYRIDELAGKGAFAQVYRATHLELNVPRAIKVLRMDSPGIGSTPFNDYRARYRQEFQIAARLDHPHVIKVFDLVEQQGVLYAVLEYAAGGSVKDLLAKQGPLPVKQSIQILLDCAAGLEDLHDKLGVIHRDIKPSNILLDADGRAKIADLGLAQVGGGSSSMRSELGSAAGMHPGTSNYRSPEHNGWEPLTPTSDVYSLGCVAFEMLTGQVWKQVMHKIARVRDLRADMPKWLDSIVMRMLCMSPGLIVADTDDLQKRFVTMSGCAAAIHAGMENVARKEEEDRRLRQAQEQAQLEHVGRERHLQAESEDRKRCRRKAIKWGIGVMGMVAFLLFCWWIAPSVFQRTPAPTLELPRRIAEATLVPATAMLPNATPIIIVVTATAIPPTPTAIATNTPRATTAPTATPAPRAGDTRRFPPDNAPMVYVTAGEFTMGSDTGDSDEKPVHTVHLDAFWMDKYEVTTGLYKKCVDAGRCSPPSASKSYTRSSYYGNSQFDNYPVIYVSWDDAVKYCAWAGKRLPTEAEWEKAARGTDGRIYPWGNSWDGAKVNFCDKNCADSYKDTNSDDGYADTAPVGTYPNGASPYGAMDMAGNVWEWVADWYGENYYASSPRNNPTGPSSGQSRVVRGGSWYYRQYYVRAAYRSSNPPVSRLDFLGVRCAQ